MTSEPVDIVEYDPSLAGHFRNLNLEWIEQSFKPEPMDLMILGNPVEHILRGGGVILFARQRDVIVGTCALIPEVDCPGHFELAKMAVTASARGRGIGRHLLESALRRFASLGGTQLHLETSSRLGAAIHLYESVGFERVSRADSSAYTRADVYMVYSATGSATAEGRRWFRSLNRGNTALLVIDVQRGFEDPSWGRRNHPLLESTLAGLLSAWRAAHLRLIHVHHESASPTGVFQKGSLAARPKPEAAPLPGEPVYLKTVNSAFIGTTLQADLRKDGVDTLVVVGLTTPHCVSTTLRMAANLGFACAVVRDATAAFEGKTLDGVVRPAQSVHENALADLAGEFAEIVSAADAREFAEEKPTSLPASKPRGRHSHDG